MIRPVARFLALVLLALAGLVGSARGSAVVLSRTLTGDNVRLTLASPFQDLPPGGCVPYRATLRNDTGTAGTWHLSIQAYSSGSTTKTISYQQNFAVAANTEASFDLIVPLPTPSEGQTMVNFTASGPGFDSSHNYGLMKTMVYSPENHGNQPFAVIGTNVLGVGGVAALDETVKSKPNGFYGSSLDVTVAPTDWRGYAGVANLLLKDSEWQELTPPQREAVYDYVALGGRLSLFTGPTVPVSPALRTSDGTSGNYGLGLITLVASPSFPASTEAITAAIHRDPAPSVADVDGGFSRPWALREQFGKIAVDNTFIMIFVLAFALTVGPLNVFVLAKGQKRFRLFWTTPLISVGATIVLALGILFSDGLGGAGRLLLVSFSLPGTTREIVIQEQVARTGVLLSNHWRTDQDYLITPIRDETQIGSPYRGGLVFVRPARAEGNQNFTEGNGSYGGDWFKSRSIKEQYLQAARPSRATLTVLNTDAVRTLGAPPEVLSSYPQTLERACLLDDTGHYWMCGPLAPGRKQTCTPSDSLTFQKFRNEVLHLGGGKSRALLATATAQPGSYFATGPVPAQTLLHTLDEISWRSDGVYLGRWTRGASGGGAP